MNTKHVRFVSRRGDELSGYLDLPSEGQSVGYGVLAHCFTCGKDLKPLVNMSRALTREGFGVLRFDFTGIGDSAGDFAETTLSSNVEDLIDAATYVAGNMGEPGVLVGHSLGGIAALQAASSLEWVKAVVTIGTPGSPAHLGMKLSRAREEAAKKGEASLAIGGKTFFLRKRFFDDLASADMGDVIRGMGKALLVLHSPADSMVDIENAAVIFSAARHPKSFVSLGEADHLLLKEKDAVYAGKLISAWARYYL